MQLGNKSVFFSWLRKCVRLFLPLGMRVHFFVLVINKTRKKIGRNGFVVCVSNENFQWVTLKYWIGWVCSINITLRIVYIEPFFSRCNVQLFVVIAVAVSPLDFLFFSFSIQTFYFCCVCENSCIHVTFFPHPPKSLFNFFSCISQYLWFVLVCVCVCRCCRAFRW